MRIFTFLSVLLAMQAASQTTVKIVDAQTGLPIPYANVQCGTESLISNEEGFFTVSQAAADDARLVVSYVGYGDVQTTVGLLKNSGQVVRLKPSVYELSDVEVTKLPGPDAIMAEVRRRLKDNYMPEGLPIRSRIFMRESNAFTPKTAEFSIEESTGFTKRNLAQANDELKRYTSALMNNPPRDYTDMLMNFYRSLQDKANPYKLDMIKATKLRDQSKSTSFEGMQDNLTKLLLKHLDTTKYYRVKSGWFGSHDTVTLRKDFLKSKNKNVPSHVADAKNKVLGFLTQVSPLAEKFTFINDPKAYTYRYDGAVFLDDGNFAYVISFEPDRSRADYRGKMYISAADFAIVRMQYALAEGKTGQSFNMKLLLGVKYSQNMDSGTLLFRSNDSGKGYHLHYASLEESQYFYLHRPLKFIELTETENDVVAFDIKGEGTNYKKREYRNLSRETLSEADYASVAQPDFNYLFIKQYDPKIWKDYGAIEPVEELKKYKVED